MRLQERVFAFALLIFSWNQSAAYGAEYSQQSKACGWCVAQNVVVKNKISELAQKSPVDLLAAIRSEGICIQTLRSGRLAPEKVFRWGTVLSPSGELSSITKQKGLMGKTLCQGERAESKSCISIFLAEDAPKSTLIHEYLHVLQIRQDKEWCPLAKGMWDKEKNTPDEVFAAQEKEWDVHIFLWEQREKMNLAIEDKLGIAANLLSYAQVRSAYDSKAIPYVKKEKVEQYFETQLIAYQEFLGLKKPLTTAGKRGEGAKLPPAGKK